MKKIVHHPLIKFLFFFCLFVCIAFEYGYFEQLSMRPQSTHMWRQTDCTSMTLNYYQHGMHFMQPQLHNRLGDNGYAVGEFPGLYYLVAGAYKIFGPSEFIYRLIWMIILFIGLFFLYKSIDKILKDTFWGMGIALLLFSSPVLVFYGNSFIADPTAISFSFIGWYLFLLFKESGKKKWIWFSALFFMLAGLLKLIALISFMALLIVLTAEAIYYLVKERSAAKIKEAIVQYHPFIICCIGVIIWYRYAMWYNEQHSSIYFYTKVVPLWSLTKTQVHDVIDQIWLNTRFEYYMPLTIKISIVLFALTIIFYSWRGTASLTHFISMCFASVITCILLWFEQYKYHDYYVISFLPFFPMLFMVFVKKFIVDIRIRWIAIGFKLLFTWFLFKNINYTIDRQKVRYEGWMSYNIPVTKSFMTITPYMRSLGITAEDKAVSYTHLTLPTNREV